MHEAADSYYLFLCYRDTPIHAQPTCDTCPGYTHFLLFKIQLRALFYLNAVGTPVNVLVVRVEHACRGSWLIRVSRQSGSQAI